MIGILAIVGGVIDEPAAVDQMKFGGPDIVAIAAALRSGPNAHAGVAADAGDGAGAADVDVPLVPALTVVVKSAVENHPRIGRMRWEDRVYSFDSFNCFRLWKRTPRTAPASMDRFPNALNGKIGTGLILVSWFV